MGIPSNENLAALLQDTGGVAVSLGADSTFGHYEAAGEVVLGSAGSGVVSEDESVVVSHGALAGLAVDAAITVDGRTYTIREFERIDDGKLVRVWLMDA